MVRATLTTALRKQQPVTRIELTTITGCQYIECLGSFIVLCVFMHAAKSHILSYILILNGLGKGEAKKQ